MDLNLTFRHMSPTAPLKAYVSKKIRKLEKYCEKEGSLHAILETEKLNCRCELIIHVSGAPITVQEVNTDMYASIDLAIDKAERALVRRKEKLHNHSIR